MEHDDVPLLSIPASCEDSLPIKRLRLATSSASNTVLSVDLLGRFLQSGSIDSVTAYLSSHTIQQQLTTFRSLFENGLPATLWKEGLEPLLRRICFDQADLALHIVLLLAEQIRSYTGTVLKFNLDQLIQLMVNIVSDNPQNSDLTLSFLELWESMDSHLQDYPSIFGHVRNIVFQCLGYFGCVHTHLRCKALMLIGKWCDATEILHGVSLLELVEWFTEDCDARVRERALLALLMWQSRSNEQNSLSSVLNENHMDMASQALQDANEGVRLVAVRLTLELALKPNLLTSAQIDSAFGKIATAVLDASKHVRSAAAEAMGCLAGRMPEATILQTLQRHVMSDLRVKNMFNATPEGDLEAINFNLLASGAPGAFVEGLEDEDSRVRCAAIGAIRRFCSVSSSFATAATDHLVDMLTDDIESVRLTAVSALTVIGCNLSIGQLSVVIGALRESSSSFRHTLHRLLSASKLASSDCLLDTLNGLLANLTEYPEDYLDIWRCVAAIGRRHSYLVHLHLNDLLNLHPYLQGTEPQKEDPAYITVLLLVLNAEAIAPQMTASLPDYVRRHALYLREAQPDLTPSRPEMCEEASDILVHARNFDRQHLDCLLKNICTRLDSLRTTDKMLLTCLSADLQRLAHLDTKLAARARALREWCLMMQYDFCQSEEAIEQALNACYRLQLLFSGWLPAEHAMLMQKAAELRQSSGSSVSLKIPHLPPRLREVRINLLQPEANAAAQARLHRFTAHLALNVHIHALVFHLENRAALEIWLRMPDRRELVWQPPESHWSVESSLDKHIEDEEPAELKTELQVSANAWTDPGMIEMQIGLRADNDHRIVLTQPIRIKILPHPPSRAI